MPGIFNPIHINILLPWVLIFMATGLSTSKPQLFQYVLLIDVWLLSHPHAVSTFFKPNVFHKITRAHLLILIPAVMGGLGLIAFKFGTIILFNVYFFSQWFHYMRQNYGIAISYNKGATSIGKSIQKVLLHLIPVMALLNIFSKGPIDFFGYYIYSPPISIFPESFFSWAFLIIMGYWLLQQLYCFTHKRWNPIYFFYFSSNSLLYYLVYFHMENFLIGWLGLTIYHNVQYLIFTWLDKKESSTDTPFFRYYFLVCLTSLGVFGFIELGEYFVYYYAIPFSLVATLTVNFTHYIFDSVIWRKNSV